MLTDRAGSLEPAEACQLLADWAHGPHFPFPISI